jgi:hypothetical protein
MISAHGSLNAKIVGGSPFNRARLSARRAARVGLKPDLQGIGEGSIMGLWVGAVSDCRSDFSPTSCATECAELLEHIPAKAELPAVAATGVMPPQVCDRCICPHCQQLRSFVGSHLVFARMCSRVRVRDADAMRRSPMTRARMRECDTPRRSHRRCDSSMHIAIVRSMSLARRCPIFAGAHYRLMQFVPDKS